MTDGAANAAEVAAREGEPREVEDRAVGARDRALAAAVAGYGGAVACRELADLRAALPDDADLSARERAVLRAMTARIVAGVLPGPRAVAAADGDGDEVAAALGRLFPVGP